MLISLVMATYGRYEEIDRFILSLANQELAAEKFELIIVDQNDVIEISDIVERYKYKLNIRHIRSKKKGLSFNRNIGLQYAKAELVGFPDDDCTYYPDTLSSVLEKLHNPKINAVFGAIRDRQGKDIIRKWPSTSTHLNRWNFFFLYSSITLFCRKKDILFNELLGAGCFFGSYEDADFTYQLVKCKGGCVYYPDVQVWHPPIGITEFSSEKNISYSLGFGGFCASHKWDIYILRIFFLSIAYHFALAIYEAITLQKQKSAKRWSSVFYKIVGFLKYPRHD